MINCYRPKQQRNDISDPVYIVNQIHWLEATIKTKIKELHRKIHQYDDQFNPINDLIKTNYQAIATALRQRHPSIQQIIDLLFDQDQLKGIKIPHLSTFYRQIQQKRHGWDQTYYTFRPYKKVKNTNIKSILRVIFKPMMLIITLMILIKRDQLDNLIVHLDNKVIAPELGF